MNVLDSFRVAVLATHGFEESELTEPVKALRAAGAKVEIVSLQNGMIQAFRHHDKSQMIPVDCTIDEVKAEDFDALMLPGGALNADRLRTEPKVKEFVRAFQDAGRPIAAICHAAWVLVSADVVRGRTLTSYHTIQDDIRNAGGKWVDQEVVVDNNWVTSRKPDDLPSFNREMIHLFSRTTPPVIQVAESA